MIFSLIRGLRARQNKQAGALPWVVAHARPFCVNCIGETPWKIPSLLIMPSSQGMFRKISVLSASFFSYGLSAGRQPWSSLRHQNIIYSKVQMNKLIVIIIIDTRPACLVSLSRSGVPKGGASRPWSLGKRRLDR